MLQVTPQAQGSSVSLQVRHYPVKATRNQELGRQHEPPIKALSPGRVGGVTKHPPQCPTHGRNPSAHLPPSSLSSFPIYRPGILCIMKGLPCLNSYWDRFVAV